MSAPISVYYKKFEKQLEEAASRPEKPSLLLHACCGPCSSACLERLSAHFRITVLYYNPNIYPQGEYERRRDELKRFVADFPGGGASCVAELEYDPQDFYGALQSVPDYADSPEKGERCRACYGLRLRKTAEYALERRFDYFTTTLSISPHKDAQKINECGEQCEARLRQATRGGFCPQYLYADFKKKDGFKRSLELSAEYGLYRQDYCGCVFSLQNSLTERN